MLQSNNNRVVTINLQMRFVTASIFYLRRLQKSTNQRVLMPIIQQKLKNLFQYNNDGKSSICTELYFDYLFVFNKKKKFTNINKLSPKYSPFHD